jgi:hypothetical protein
VRIEIEGLGEVYTHDATRDQTRARRGVGCLPSYCTKYLKNRNGAPSCKSANTKNTTRHSKRDESGT